MEPEYRFVDGILYEVQGDSMIETMYTNVGNEDVFHDDFLHPDDVLLAGVGLANDVFKTASSQSISPKSN